MVRLIFYFTRLENRRRIRDVIAGKQDIDTLPPTFNEFVTWLKKRVEDTYFDTLRVNEININATMPGVAGDTKLTDYTYRDHERFKDITIELIQNDDYVHPSSDAVPMPLSDRVDAVPMPVHERAVVAPTSPEVNHYLPQDISEECKSCFNERNELVSNINKLLETLKKTHEYIDAYNYYLKNDPVSSGMTTDEIETIIGSLKKEIQKHESNLSSNTSNLMINAEKVYECLKTRVEIYRKEYLPLYSATFDNINNYNYKYPKTLTGGKLNIKKSKKTSKSKMTSKSKYKRTSKSKSKRTSKSKSKSKKK